MCVMCVRASERACEYILLSWPCTVWWPGRLDLLTLWADNHTQLTGMKADKHCGRTRARQ